MTTPCHPSNNEPPKERIIRDKRRDTIDDCIRQFGPADIVLGSIRCIYQSSWWENSTKFRCSYVSCLKHMQDVDGSDLLGQPLLAASKSTDCRLWRQQIFSDQATCFGCTEVYWSWVVVFQSFLEAQTFVSEENIAGLCLYACLSVLWLYWVVWEMCHHTGKCKCRKKSRHRAELRRIVILWAASFQGCISSWDATHIDIGIITLEYWDSFENLNIPCLGGCVHVNHALYTPSHPGCSNDQTFGIVATMCVNYL